MKNRTCYMTCTDKFPTINIILYMYLNGNIRQIRPFLSSRGLILLLPNIWPVFIYLKCEPRTWILLAPSVHIHWIYVPCYRFKHYLIQNFNSISVRTNYIYRNRTDTYIHNYPIFIYLGRYTMYIIYIMYIVKLKLLIFYS